MNEILKLDNVEKYYGNKANLTKAVDKISFSVEKGEFVGIMGASGSGKTTLLNCISTIDRVTAGHIYVGDKDITTIRGNELNKFRREELGFIFQDFNLLDTFSLRDNIYLPLVLTGEDYREMEQKIRPIAQALKITELLDKFPYEVSGGQKQRLAIARALARKPEILIFDDSFSALDYKTDRKLRQELAEKTQDMTKLIVAQRISTIMDADQILVLDKGKVVGQGTHEELLANNEVYQEIAYSQLSKEELEDGK